METVTGFFKHYFPSCFSDANSKQRMKIGPAPTREDVRWENLSVCANDKFLGAGIAMFFSIITGVGVGIFLTIVSNYISGIYVLASSVFILGF